MFIRRSFLWLVVAAALTSWQSTEAAITTWFDFNLVDTGNGNSSLNDQLRMAVEDVATNKIKFTFYNLAPTFGANDSYIGNIYFDDGAYLSAASVKTDSDGVGLGVAYSYDASPNTPKPPSSPAFAGWETTAALYSIDADQGHSGVRMSGTIGLGQTYNLTGAEWVSVTYNLVNGVTYQQAITGLTATNQSPFRVGLHIQGIVGGGGNSDSDWYIQSPIVLPPPVVEGTEVPEPISFVIWGSSLTMMGLAAWRRRRAAAAL